MENLVKGVCVRLRLFDSRSPFALAGSKDTGYILQEMAGKMIRKPDSTEYYNIDSLAATARIVLRHQFKDRLFVYDQRGVLMDSVPLKPGKYASLIKDKEDVFLLYRGWLELQWQQVADQQEQFEHWLNEQDSGLYSPISWEVGRREVLSALVSLKVKQHRINGKINSLVIPQEKAVEQLIAIHYRNEQSEMSYLPGLGFGYKEDIPVRGGLERPDFIHPDKMMEKYPALKEWSEKWTKTLRREITPAAFKPGQTTVK